MERTARGNAADSGMSVQPIQLVTGDEHGGRAWLWMVAAAGTVAVVLSGLVWAWAVRRAAIARQPAEYAFRSLAKELGVKPGLARLVHRLSPVHTRAAPVALLLSGHALAEAITSFEQHNPSRRDRRVIERVREAFGIADRDAS